MSEPRPVQFTLESAERIASVVRTAEVTPRQLKPLVFERPPEHQRKQIRFGTISSEWPVGGEIEVTIGEEGAGEPTVTAINNLRDVPIADFREKTKVAIARDRGQWAYVNHEQTGCGGGVPAREITGAGLNLEADASSLLTGPGAQVLINAGGCMAWVGLTPITVITGASIQGTSIVFTRASVWVLADGSMPSDLTLAGTDCNK